MLSVRSSPHPHQESCLRRRFGDRRSSDHGARRQLWHRSHHAGQPQPEERLRPRDAPADGRVPRRARLRRRHQGRGASRRGRRVQHGRRHEQRLRLVRRRREGRPRERRHATSAEPTTARADRPPDVRLLPVVPRVSEGDGGGGRRLRPRRGLRVGAHGRHLGGGVGHEGRHARHPAPGPGPRVTAPLLPPSRTGVGPTPAAHRRHHRSRRHRSPGCVHRGRRGRRGHGPGGVVGREGVADAGGRDRAGQGGVPPHRAAVGVPGRAGAQPPPARLRHEPAVRRGRVQLRQGPGRARDQGGLRPARRPLRGPRALQSGPELVT